MAPCRRHVVTLIALWLVLASAGTVCGQQPPGPDLFQAGIYADDSRTLTCLAAQPGDRFQQFVWAWVPDSLGLAYITLRFEFPANIDFSARPVFNDLVGDVIITEYNNGTSEWNLLVHECPSGWVRIFSQECVVLDAQPVKIGIQATHSMMRDCTFILNDMAVLNELAVNDPDCHSVADQPAAWGAVKSLYR